MKAGWKSKYKRMRRRKHRADLQCRELDLANRALRMEVDTLKNLCLQLWGEMGTAEVKVLQSDAPEVVSFRHSIRRSSTRSPSSGARSARSPATRTRTTSWTAARR